MTQGAAMTSCNDDELVERLRAFACTYAVIADLPEVSGDLPEHVFNEAADRISQLAEQLKEAEEQIRRHEQGLRDRFRD